MKRISVLFVLCVLMYSCSKPANLPALKDTSQAVKPETTADAVNRVATDPELLREALVLADHKGTLETGLTEAAQDSLVGLKMREALVLGNVAKSKATPPPGK